MHEELKTAQNRVVGLKQLLRELATDNVTCIYIALNVDDQLKAKIAEAVDGREIPVVEIDSMDELGQVCEIDVGAACAAILKNKSS